MAGERTWLFKREQIKDTPSRKHGISEEDELSARQRAASHIQAMGLRLKLTLLCTNTAVVYMHRFYMFQSLKDFNKDDVAAACLFLAAKVEEQPTKLEHIIKVSHYILHKTEEMPTPAPLDNCSEAFLKAVGELVRNENILLQVLGFNVTVEHSNTQVVKFCQMLQAPKGLAQSSYFLCTNCLHLTLMCIQYTSKTIAAVCIHLACIWDNWELPKSKEGKNWWEYVDPHLTLTKLEEITQEFLSIVEKTDPKLQRQLKARAKANAASPDSRANSPAPSSSSRPSSKGSSSHHHPSSSRSYQEHRDKKQAAARSDDGRSPAGGKPSHRPIHRESPLVRGDLKRPHPTESQQGTQSKHVPSSSKPHDPYNQHRTTDKRHQQQYPHSSINASPHKKQKTGENGSNSIPRPPYSKPAPKPPPPPT